MGCQVIKREDRVTLEGPQKLKGIEIDMGSIPDAVPALSAVAAFCKEDTLIHNIAHLRYKECDRIKAIDQELSKLGIRVDSRADEIIINGKGLKNKAVTFDPRNDHRIAMSMALIGLRVPGIKIGNPECVNKSFPGYWNKLQEIGVDVREV
jgi:3-phosphoshikimate 1-carboxyvinyltransferase